MQPCKCGCAIPKTGCPNTKYTRIRDHRASRSALGARFERVLATTNQLAHSYELAIKHFSRATASRECWLGHLFYISMFDHGFARLKIARTSDDCLVALYYFDALWLSLWPYSLSCFLVLQQSSISFYPSFYPSSSDWFLVLRGIKLNNLKAKIKTKM
jgi:hypothetical protein